LLHLASCWVAIERDRNAKIAILLALLATIVFADDAARVALLFKRYQQLTAGLLAALVEKPKKKRKG
jgi:hypothetical protein